MKKLFFIIPVLALLAACTPKVKPVVQTTTNTEIKAMTFMDSVSYLLGASSANRLKESLEQEDLIVNQALYLKGVRESFNGTADSTLFNETNEQELLTRLQSELSERNRKRQEKESAGRKQKSVAFLANNAKKPGVKVTDSGLQYEVLEEGTGDMPVASDKVKVHYEGRLIDGEIFDSSIQRGKPAEFKLNGVIKGWTEGLQLMKVGSKYRFTIPSDLAYGNRNVGDKIKGGDALIFDVELLEIVK